MSDIVTIDGASGEGGGQIVRTALGLSLVTGRPMRIINVRGRRKRPGLLRQHVTAVRAAAAIGSAGVSGAELGAREVELRPGAVRPGDYHFDIGSAGSTTLVAQTVLPALWSATGPSTLTLEGGTHNPLAPPFDFLARAFAPLLARIGPRLECELIRYGFAPRGGGKIRLRVQPAPLAPLELLERGSVARRIARAVVASLPPSIAERELQELTRKLAPHRLEQHAETVAGGPGNAVTVDLESAGVTEVFSAPGAAGVPAERVAASVAREVKAYERAGVPVGPHLADQLLIPLALAGGGTFRTTLPTTHTQTNARVIESFLPVVIEMREDRPGWLVTVRRGS